jgi:hypothetical protein
MSRPQRILGALLAAMILVATPVAHSTASEDLVSVAATAEQIAAVRSAAAHMSPGLSRLFEVRFAAWKKTWSEPPLVFSSNPHDATRSKKFRDLVALGRDILPAVVEKLIDPDNFFALQLYEAIQTHRSLVASSIDDGFDSEQARARKTIRLYANSL